MFQDGEKYPGPQCSRGESEVYGNSSASMGLGEVSTLQNFSSEQDVLLAWCWEGSPRFIRYTGHVLAGIKITAMKAMGNNSVFRVTAGILDSCLSFNPPLTTGYQVLG